MESKIKLDLIFEISCLTIFIFMVLFLFYQFYKEINIINKDSNLECLNVKVIEKDDILSDKYYIICNNDDTFRIDFELYARIVENEDYLIQFNNLGSIYSITGLKDKDIDKKVKDE